MKYTVYLTNDSDMGDVSNMASQQFTLQEVQRYLQQSPQNAVVFEHDGVQTAFFQGADYSFNTWYYQDLPLEEPDAEQIVGNTLDALDTMVQECGF